MRWRDARQWRGVRVVVEKGEFMYTEMIYQTVTVYVHTEELFDSPGNIILIIFRFSLTGSGRSRG